jgi:hypothetical protein
MMLSSISTCHALFGVAGRCCGIPGIDLINGELERVFELTSVHTGPIEVLYPVGFARGSMI